jgi:hypothetical protein
MGNEMAAGLDGLKQVRLVGSAWADCMQLDMSHQKLQNEMAAVLDGLSRRTGGLRTLNSRWGWCAACTTLLLNI